MDMETLRFGAGAAGTVIVTLMLLIAQLQLTGPVPLWG